MTVRRKLIEVALPLDAINRACVREKAIRHGHPSTLHLWWARRPLAACRAVLFASLVDDPSSDPELFPTEKAQEDERRRLFDIIERLVLWENTTNEAVLEEARAEIRRSTGGNPPPVLDPFCGGGSIPFEAQRLGLEAHASDLNPVAVLITKALIEIPPRFAGRPPVHPDARRGVGATGQWKGAAGLAADVRRYGAWMRDEAERRIGHLYPKVRLPKEHGGGEATVIAWLWARTVRCPNPACGATMPLARSFALSTKAGKEAWVEPIVDREARTVRFTVRTGKGKPPDPPKVGRGANFRCLVCGQVAPDTHVKAEGVAGRMDAQLMAIVAEGQRGRIYLAPDDEHDGVARSAVPSKHGLTEELADDPRNIWCVQYGLRRFRDLFTPRQLVALTTFSDLVTEARERVRHDAVAAGLPDDGVSLADGGTGAPAYADALATYLAFAVDRVIDRHSTIATWDSSPSKLQLRNTFARQAIPMTWDFGEGNPFCESSGTWSPSISWVAEVVASFMGGTAGRARQLDATASVDATVRPLVSTDPPYYDNIGYADLSDFFYVWLRRSIGSVYPDLFGTLLTPKARELVACPYRFDGSKAKAEHHFEHGLHAAFDRIRASADPDYPVTVYYAFKQAESERNTDGGQSIASTGWETMLEALLRAGFSVDGTWPMRSELGNRMMASGTNALASSIVLVCRPRPDGAPVTSRKDFLARLRAELPPALRALQHGSIAPVDLAQAAIGPGMAVFSRYARVLEPDGRPMRVRTALGLINAALDEVLNEQVGDYDPDTRFAVTWFSQRAFGEGPSGEAIDLSRSYNTSLEGLQTAGVFVARHGKARLLRRDELAADWNPREDRRLAVWEVTQHLVHALDKRGESDTAALLAQVGGLGDAAHDLAYRLFTICERNRWTEEALGYNALVMAWPELSRLAGSSALQPAQAGLFD
jgi:putative DNA methylase